MAYVGLAKPYIAKLDSQSTSAGVTTPSYTGGFVCGKAISINVTPNYNEAKLYADNALDEYVKEFKDGSVTLGTDRLPSVAQSTMFGHSYDSSEKETTYKSGDLGSYVGVGFYVDEIKDGVKTYVASILYKCLFTEGAKDYATKGDSIEFKTPSLEGAIAVLEDGQWKKDKEFTTEADAEAWIKTTLNIAP